MNSVGSSSSKVATSDAVAALRRALLRTRSRQQQLIEGVIGRAGRVAAAEREAAVARESCRALRTSLSLAAPSEQRLDSQRPVVAPADPGSPASAGAGLPEE